MHGRSSARKRHRGTGDDIKERLVAFLYAVIGQERPRRRKQAPSQQSRRQSPVRAQRAAAPVRPPLIVRQDVSVPKLLGLSAVLCGVAWLAWQIVSNPLLYSLATSNPELALKLSSDQPRALDTLATRELIDPDGNLDTAKDLARQALQLSPFDQRPYLVLLEVAEKQKDTTAAAGLLQFASDKMWRNLPLQLILLDRRLSQEHFDQALLHADAVLRVQPSYQPKLLPILSAFLLNPRASASIERFLGTAPPWREWFIEQLSQRLVNRSLLDPLYASLIRSPNPPRPEEQQAYLERLIKDRQYSEASQEWLRTLPHDERPDGKFPYNRDFLFPLDGSPFNWRVTARNGASIRVVPVGKSRELRAEFSGARTYPRVQQLMLLPAGKYVFKGEVEAEGLRAARGLWWRIYCADSPNDNLTHTDLVSSDRPRQPFENAFEVPASGCSAQWLQLEIPARIAPEYEIEGQVSYRLLSIEPLKDTGISAIEVRP
jgi:hypothetical protein